MNNLRVKFSRVARIEDLPYYTSPPIQFVHTQQAVLNAGTYPLALNKVTMQNTVQLSDNSLIYIRDMSFYADIERDNYQRALQLAAGTVDVPRLSLYFSGNASNPILRNPVFLGDYFRNQPYRLLKMPKATPNTIDAAIQGTLQQHAGLAGIAQINLTVEVYCQEIVDDAFIAAVTKKYPQVQNEGVYL